MSDFRSLMLYVIRHGECEHNAARWAAGHDDSPLTARGREQARANGRLLGQLAGNLSALDFVASSLHRTCCTMELLREAAGLPPSGYRADHRLMEGHLGDHTRTGVDALAIHPDFLADRWNYGPPGGESFAAIHGRVGRFLNALARDSVIVTHMLPAIMIRAHYLGLTPEQAMEYEQPNAGLLRLSMGTDAYFGE